MNDYTEGAGSLAARPQSGAMIAIEQQRAIAQVQAAMMLARQFPRDVAASYARVMEACKRMSVAEGSQYSYSRGGTPITGPSIRLLEVIAQQWGNIEFGIRELEQRQGVTLMEAYSWDIETNTRQTRSFHVKHERSTKRGNYAIDDPRDVYELAANMGGRRMRACLEAIIPRDVVDAAVDQCNKTLAGNNEQPIADIARDMLVKFAEFGVSQEMIETRIQHSLSAITRLELVGLRKVYVSLKDGFADRSQYFEVPGKEPKEPEMPQTLADKVAALGKRVVQPAEPASNATVDKETGEVGAEQAGETAPGFGIEDVRAALREGDNARAMDLCRGIEDPVLRRTAEGEVRRAAAGTKE